jgi:hypothetical protein
MKTTVRSGEWWVSRLGMPLRPEAGAVTPHSPLPTH